MQCVVYFGRLIFFALAGTPFPDLDRAVPLLLGTAVQESMLTHFRQLGGGPARGLFQMEVATERDHWRWLTTAPIFRAAVLERSGVSRSSARHLEYNIPYQILMARLHYYRRDPHRLPEPRDIEAQAARWKRYYNTPAGRGTVEQYLRNWQTFVAPHTSVLFGA